MSEAGLPGEAGATTALSDPRLAQRAADGDERAFAAIFDRYHQRLYRYCLALVGDSQDAQDALQNTMVKVLRALPGEKRQIELKPWLYRIAHNESIELLRRRRDVRPLNAELIAPGSGLAAEVVSRERLRQLISDLEDLPERQRGALVMRELSGLDFPQIGTALGTSAAVARQTVYEARLGLRQMDLGREMDCETVAKALSDGDGRVARRRDVRAHLRSCPSCRRFRDEIEARERDFAALSPLPAAVATSLLQGLLGGGGGGGLAAALGGGAVKSLGSSAVLKGAATIAVVAAIGAGVADRGGLIHLGPQGDDGSPATQVAPPRGEGSKPPNPSSGIVTSSKAGTPANSDRVAAGVGPAHNTEAGSGPAPSPTGSQPSPAVVESPSTRGVPVAHPHGKGHEKQLPAASAHGQQTATAKKTAEHGAAAGGGHRAHQAKSPHPSHPSTPGAEKGQSAPKEIPAPEPAAHGNANAQPASGEEASPPGDSGKKP
jgi:RNA polymerase sigma factor (sigma-70 family)